jgi:hypothetical protein
MARWRTMSIRYVGPLGTDWNNPVNDQGTSPPTRLPTPGPYCSTLDPSFLERVGRVKAAWDLACNRYLSEAITRHAGDEIHAVLDGLKGALVISVKVLLGTTLVGAGVGGLAGGVGAGPGAGIGFRVGLWLLEWLGMGFLVVYLGSHLKDVGVHFNNGVRLAWNACGGGALEEAAREMAEGIGVFVGLMIQGVFLLVMQRGLSAAVSAVGKSRLGVNFGRWVQARVTLRGFLKGVEKPPGEYLFNKDPAGRPLEAEGWLMKREGVRVDDKAVHAEVTRSLEGYHAGHLIPDTFKGPSSPENLVPMPETTNLSYVKAIENAIGRHLHEGPVYLKVTVDYVGPGKAPSMVQHRFYRMGPKGMEMLPGGYITTNLGITPSVPMGKVVAPKDFLSPDPTKGVANKLPQ